MIMKFFDSRTKEPSNDLRVHLVTTHYYLPSVIGKTTPSGKLCNHQLARSALRAKGRKYGQHQADIGKEVGIYAKSQLVPDMGILEVLAP